MAKQPQIPEDVVVVPTDGCLDLHTFRPRDIGTLVPDYLAECRREGILEVRIVHGKGRGELRKGVEALLPRVDGVVRWRPAYDGEGGWGATIVYLAPLVRRGGEH
jgi:dsDNA-specific endonuclease/ATPase MutS2